MLAFKIRLLTNKDYSLIQQISHWQYEEWGHVWANNSLNRTLLRISERTNQYFLPLTIIAYHNQNILGCACLIQYGMWGRLHQFPWLDSVYVNSSHRRQGIGAILVKKGCYINKNLGYKSLYLYTPNKEDFYKQLGWVSIERKIYEHKVVSIMKIKT